MMNNDLISRSALYRKIKTECNPYGKPTIDFESGKRVLDIIDNAPEVDILSEIIDYIQKKKEYYANGSMCSIAESINGEAICDDILKYFEDMQKGGDKNDS